MPICILGMHRSGTSMITKLLNEMGMYLGEADALMKPSQADNPTGYWEVQAIADFNDELLEALGGSWEHPPIVEPGWSQKPEFKIFYHRAKTLFADYMPHSVWGWKDPRSMLTLEFWLNIFPDLKLVLCMRHPMEVARSLSTGKPMRTLEMSQALDLWLQYHKQLLVSVDNHQLIVTHYESYFYEPVAELQRVATALGITVSETNVQDALATIRTDLRHHHLPSIALERKSISSEIRQVYEGFCLDAGTIYAALRADAQYQLQSLNAFTRNMLTALDQLEQETIELNEANQHLIEVYEQVQEEAQQLHSTVARKDADLERTQAEIQQLSATVTRKDADLVAMQGELTRVNTTLTQKQHDLEEARQRVSEIEAVQQTGREQMAGLQNQFDHLQRTNAYLNHELTVIKRSLIFRAIANPVWKLRRRIAPENSRRYTVYRKLRRSLRRSAGLEDPWVSASPPPSPVVVPSVPLPTTITAAARPAPTQSSEAPPPMPAKERPLTAPSAPHDVVIFTIVSKNYLSHARTLMESIYQFHKDVHLVVLLVDEIGGYYDPSQEVFETILASEIGIPRWQHFAMKYTIMELNTAVKPFALEVLFDHFQAQKVIYFDPDITVYQPLTHLFDLLNDHTIVLTPHLLDPIDDNYHPTELEIMRAGVYNLGFGAFSRRANWREFLHWWQEKLYSQCIVAVDRGIFVDQSWMNIAPAFADDVHVLRHPGYNVAYWNIKTRDLQFVRGEYQVNGQTLIFFHFSGFSPDSPKVVSKHQNRYQMSDLNTAYQQCYADYAKQLTRHGYAAVRKWSYFYGVFSNGVPISDAARLALLQYDPNGDHWANPYDATTSDGFYQWLTTPHLRYLSPYALIVYEMRIDVQSVFPSPQDAGEADYAHWFANCTDDAVLFDAGYRNPVRRALGLDPLPEPPRHVLATDSPSGSQVEGINLIGYAYSETGVGQLLRNNAKALQSRDFPVAVYPLDTGDPARQQDRSVDRLTLGAPYSVNLFHVNADMTYVVRESLNPKVYQHRYNIGFWAWELATFPEKWRDRFDAYDEIWVLSMFVRDGIAAYTSKPVKAMPISIEVELRGEVKRRELGLPEDAHIVLYAFDAGSIIQRKNPYAVIDAFEKAFSTAERATKARLVLKINNLSRFPEEAQRLRSAMARVNGIIINQYFDRHSINALLNHADTYISLHRSEGYGLTMAESMYLGKPVIGTGYSGNLDFMNEHNSYLVPYQLVNVPPNCPPYDPSSQWAEPDVETAAAYLRHIYDHPDEARARGEIAVAYMREHHSSEAVGSALLEQITALRQQAGIKVTV